MKAIKKLSLVILLFVSMFAHGAPNVWQSSFGMGVIEYSLSNSKNQMITVSCNIGGLEYIDHGFDYYPRGFEGDSKVLKNMSVLLDGKTVVYPPTDDGLPTSTRGGANNWIQFTSGISKARKIQVYSNNRLVATFTPTAASIRAEARDIADCEPKE